MIFKYRDVKQTREGYNKIVELFRSVEGRTESQDCYDKTIPIMQLQVQKALMDMLQGLEPNMSIAEKSVVQESVAACFPKKEHYIQSDLMPFTRNTFDPSLAGMINSSIGARGRFNPQAVEVDHGNLQPDQGHQKREIKKGGMEEKVFGSDQWVMKYVQSLFHQVAVNLRTIASKVLNRDGDIADRVERACQKWLKGKLREIKKEAKIQTRTKSTVYSMMVR